MKSDLQKPISTNFSKGLTFAASHLVDPEECQITDNFIFGDGTATVRQGTQLYGTVPAPVVALCRHYNKDGSAYLLAVAGGVCYVSYASGVFSAVSSDPISGFVSVAPYDDFVYIASTSGVVKYFDGSSMNIAGISSPTLQTTIGDFTNPGAWGVVGGSGTVTADTNLTHIGLGTQAIEINNAANYSSVMVTYPVYQDLTHFSDIVSDSNDLVTIMTTHNVKSYISSIILGFKDYSGDTATAAITNLSSWVGCSSDGWTLNHSIPKVRASSFTYIYQTFQNLVTFPGYIASGYSYALTTLSSTLISGTILSGGTVSGTYLLGQYLLSGSLITVVTASGTFVSGLVLSGPILNSSPLFTITTSNFIYNGFTYNSGFSWGSCYPFINLTASANNSSYSKAQVTFSDCLMVKTPAIPIAVTVNLAPSLFYGSSQSMQDRFFSDPNGFEQNFQGQASVNPAILDGMVYYKTTFLKQGPTGLQIESVPSQQSSGCVLSSVTSSYLVSASGTALITPQALGWYSPNLNASSPTIIGYTNQFQPIYNFNPVTSYVTTSAIGAWQQGFAPNYWTTLSNTPTSSWTSGTYYPVSWSGAVMLAAMSVSGANISSVVGTHYINLLDIPLAPAAYNCNARNVYRRMATDPAYQFVYQIGDNITTQFIDSVPFQVLGAVIDETRWPPPIAKYIYAAANQQTYYLNIIENGTPYPSRVRYSNVYEPYYVPLNNVFDVSPGDGTQLTGMFEFANLQFLLKERSTWLLDPSTGIPSQMHHIYGCIAPNSIAVGPNVVFWLSDDGIIEFNLNFNNISQGKAKINTFIKTISKQNLAMAAGVYFNEYYLLAIDANGDGTNDTILVYDTVSGEWSKFPNIYVTSWSVWGGSQDGGRLFYGNNSGQICEFLVDTTDLGNPIPWTIQTKDFGIMTPQEAYREVFLFTKDLDGQSRTIQAIPFYDMTYSSSDVDSINTSGYTSGIGLGKISLQPKDGASFFSMQFSSSGRVQVVRMDVYSKEESLR